MADADPNGMTVEMLKQIMKEVGATLMNKIAKVLKEIVILPIYKSGKNDQAVNYKPISRIL